MSNRVCIKLPGTDEQFCFDIPILVKRDWHRPVPPERRLELGPQPEPWMESHRVRPEIALDVQVLASIHSLSMHLTEGPQAAFQEAVRGQIAKLQLPKELQVHLEQYPG
ncbi:MAG: hypothetical protein EOP82_23325 [Variovorax sp.]|nr:MAG: hypothetical protein EOP82_23325 [Variovorax sp.]